MSTPYPSEELLVSELQRHDALLLDFKRGALGLNEFCGAYSNFYWELALDGHESDESGRLVLAKYHKAIERHRIISELALHSSTPVEKASEVIREQARRVPSSEI